MFQMSELEETAATLVVAELGAERWIRTDDGSLGIQMRDFDIVFQDGRTEPLEVTTSADRLVMQAMARMENRRQVPAPGKRTWAVLAPYTFTDSSGERVPIDGRRCLSLLPGFIAGLEAEGYEQFDTGMLAYNFRSPHQPVARELFEMGVHFGSSYEPSDPEDIPSIHLSIGSGGAYGPTNITRAAEREASREDNQAKLAACIEAPRRHLYVVLTSASEELEYVALLTVLQERLPNPPIPVLPDAITTVWAGTLHAGIYVTPPGQWQRFGDVAAGEQASTQAQ